MGQFLDLGRAPLVLLDVTDGGTLTTAAALTTTSSSTNVALVNGVVMMGQRANLYVQDGTGIGFATQDGSNNLVRYTGATSLNGNTGGATTNTTHYSLSADLTRSATLNFSSLAIDTSANPVTLDMGTFNMSSSGNGRSILVTGSNNATITSSTGVFTSGQSYNAIKKQVQNLQSYTLSEYQSYIWENGVAKNNARCIDDLNELKN